MIRLFSSKTGQALGVATLQTGDLSLDPESIRRLMNRLADSEIGHLVSFSFETHTTNADCLFGKNASNLPIGEHNHED